MKPTNLKLILLFFIGISKFTIQAQGIGSWKDYLPYHNITSITKGENEVYGATENAILIMNYSDNYTEKLTRINALSDIGITKINFNVATKSLLIGYLNGNVDVVKNNTTTNFPQIKNSPLVGDKSIYGIFFKNELAYLACGFGIVVIDLNKEEIKETYIIGAGGTQLKVNDIIIDNGVIYTTTNKGVFRANETDPFLTDYNSWTKITTIPNSNKEFKAIEAFSSGNLLVTLAGNGNTIKDSVYHYNGTTWNSLNTGEKVASIFAGNNKILINHYDSILVLDYTLTVTEKLYKYSSYWEVNANDALWDGTNYYTGDNQLAIVQVQSNQISRIDLPKGPGKFPNRDLDIENGHLWASTGHVTGTGWNSTYSLDGIFHYDIANDNWEIYRGYCFYGGADSGKCLYDFLGVAVNPVEPEKGYACSFSNKALIGFKNGATIEFYDSSNSSLQMHNINAGKFASADAVFDEDSYLWVANTMVSNPLSVKAPNGTWQNFYCGSLSKNKIASKIIIDKLNGYKWLVFERKHVLAYNSGSDPLSNLDDQYQELTNEIGNGNIHAPPICITEDLDGEIWIGTEEGVTVIYNSINIFEGGDFDAQRIKIEQDGNVEYLLSSDQITAIEIDGGNRKWIGTSSSGVYVLSPDGQEQINHFTFENSPLFSNTILDIAINHLTGEVFISTQEGIISYRGEATLGDVTFKEVYAYPNPVKPNYTGPITIKGLMRDSDVRITDLTGNIVFATKSIGGQAIWNGKNLDGVPVQTGVYLVFLIGPEGANKEATKILFVK